MRAARKLVRAGLVWSGRRRVAIERLSRYYRHDLTQRVDVYVVVAGLTPLGAEIKQRYLGDLQQGLSRQQAEARVAAKADRQAALEKLGDLYLQFAASPKGTRFLEMQQSELVAPRNDPEYLNAVLAREDRQVPPTRSLLCTTPSYGVAIVLA